MSETVTDDQGEEWTQVTIDPEDAKRAMHGAINGINEAIERGEKGGDVKLQALTAARLRAGTSESQLINSKVELVPFLLQSGFTEKDAQRFIAKIDDGGGPGACWWWLASKDSCGYGKFSLKRRLYGSHRLVCSAVYGSMRGLQTLHSCDKPACCNPRHLRPGTLAENCQEAAQRLMAGNQKLTPSDVRAIRCWLKIGYRHGEIAEPFGVTRKAVTSINIGKAWCHLQDENTSIRPRSRRSLSDSHQDTLSCGP